jgi:hypothetical protein
LKKKQAQRQVLRLEMKSSMAHETAKRESKQIKVSQIHEFAMQQAAKQDAAKEAKTRRVVVSEQMHEFALQQAAKQEEAKNRRKKRKSDPQPPPLMESTAPPPLPSIETTDFWNDNDLEGFNEMPDVGDFYATNEVEEGPNNLVAAPPLPINITDATQTIQRKSRKKLDETRGRQSSSSSPATLMTEAGKAVDASELDINIMCTNQASLDDGKANIDNSSQALDQRQGPKVHFKGDKNPVVIDTQVLASECDGGRYPTMNRFEGAHLVQCVLCVRVDADDDDPLIDCDFCKNTVHQICLNKKMLNKDPPLIIREQEPHDSLMCHDCIMYCIARRVRAESRRTSKWHYELSRVGLTHPDAANLAQEVDLSNENNNNDSEKVDDTLPIYSACPQNGPGGLICCAHCTASYSRFLSNTAKEMEAQSVAKAGQEVNEILDLLADAKKRLLNATDVSRMNAIRRKLLRNNEV